MIDDAIAAIHSSEVPRGASSLGPSWTKGSQTESWTTRPASVRQGPKEGFSVDGSGTGWLLCPLPQSSTAATSAAELVRKGEHDADQLAQNVLLVSYPRCLPAVGCNPHGPSISWGGGTNDMIYATAPDTFTYVTTESWGRGLPLSRADAGDPSRPTPASFLARTSRPSTTRTSLRSLPWSPAKVPTSSSMGLVATQIYNPGCHRLRPG